MQVRTTQSPFVSCHHWRRTLSCCHFSVGSTSSKLGRVVYRMGRRVYYQETTVNTLLVVAKEDGPMRRNLHAWG